MTEETWIKGMALLVANLTSPDLTPEMAMLRGDTYRRKLGHLTDEAWLYAVDQALERPGPPWFPGIGELLDSAARAPQPVSRGVLSDDTRSLEERRADFRRGFEEVLRPQLCAHGIHIDCECEPKEITATAEAVATEGRS